MESRTTAEQDTFQNAVFAAIAFGNSTGLPLTLVSIVHNSASATSGLSAVDPSLFVSIYLIFNPILQWSVGLWLLQPPPTSVAPPGSSSSSSSSSSDDSPLSSPSSIKTSKKSKHGFIELVQESSPFHSVGSQDESEEQDDAIGNNSSSKHNQQNKYAAVKVKSKNPYEAGSDEIHINPSSMKATDRGTIAELGDVDIIPNCFTTSCKAILKQASQPVILASLIGLFIACIEPLRGILVDIHDQDGDAPLEFIFEAMYTIGKAAIPVISDKCLLHVCV
jgi:predicted permease